MKYQIVYQGYEPDPNQELLEDPVDFEEAHRLAAEMQAEDEMDAKDVQSTNHFYVVTPVFR